MNEWIDTNTQQWRWLAEILLCHAGCQPHIHTCRCRRVPPNESSMSHYCTPWDVNCSTVQCLPYTMTWSAEASRPPCSWLLPVGEGRISGTLATDRQSLGSVEVLVCHAHITNTHTGWTNNNCCENAHSKPKLCKNCAIFRKELAELYFQMPV